MSTGTMAPDEVSAEETSPDVATVDGDPETVDVDHTPPQLSRVLAVVAGAIGVALTAPFAVLAIPFALAGFAILAGSLFVVHSRGWLSIGAGLMLLGAIISGGYGVVPVEFMLIGAGAAILSWDVGQYSIGIGTQLGRQAPTRGIEIAHAAFTVGALTLASGFVYVVFLFAGAGRPASAVAISLIGAVVLVWVYRT